MDRLAGTSYIPPTFILLKSHRRMPCKPRSYSRRILANLNVIFGLTIHDTFYLKKRLFSKKITMKINLKVNLLHKKRPEGRYVYLVSIILADHLPSTETIESFTSSIMTISPTKGDPGVVSSNTICPLTAI